MRGFGLSRNERIYFGGCTLGDDTHLSMRASKLDETWSFVAKKNVKRHEIVKGDQYISSAWRGTQKAIIS